MVLARLGPMQARAGWRVTQQQMQVQEVRKWDGVLGECWFYFWCNSSFWMCSLKESRLFFPVSIQLVYVLFLGNAEKKFRPRSL